LVTRAIERTATVTNVGEHMQHVGERLARSLPWLEGAAEWSQPVVAKLVGSRPWLGDLLDGTWFGAPLHPALTDATVGSWTAAFVLDGVSTATNAEGVKGAADAALAVGVASALPTAMTGASDWRVLVGEQRRIALLHGLLNSTALTLNVASLVCRQTGRRGIGRALSALGFGVASTSAHIGGELSFGMGIRVNQTFRDDGPTDFVSVGSESDFEDRELHKVSVNGTDVLIARSESGDLCAISSTCSHLSGPLDEGTRQGDVVVCPWHGSRFDLCSGRVVGGPAVYDQPRFETRVLDGQVQVRRANGPP
jgi:nitrite reductase/ring-hydroxylating ferredoxin subunit